MTRLVCLFLFIFLYLKLQPSQADIEVETVVPLFGKYRREHKPKILSDSEISYLARRSNVSYTEKILDNILIPRAVRTANHSKVFEYIVGELRKHNLHVEIDEFTALTPKFKELVFKNIMGTLNPKAERYLVLACHYDSKYFANETNDARFVGATDGAAPCAMMLNLIAVMKDHLAKIRDRTDLTLQLIFFDGRESFETFGPYEYGSINFVEVYGNRRVIAKSVNETITDLDKIDLLIMLNLLGAPDPNFYSYYKNTERWYVRLLYAEECLQDLKRLKGSRKNRYFQPRFHRRHIEDDHVPFIRNGVPVLPIIASPSPDAWHTLGDNRTLLDSDTIEDLNKILRVFVTEYLHLPVNV